MLGLVVALCLVDWTRGASPAEIRTSLGTVKGSILPSREGRPYLTFTRIPYARPPVGLRRFMPPEPADSWSGMLDATQPSPQCLQSNSTHTIGQEDCLYLNIYTPTMNSDNVFSDMKTLSCSCRSMFQTKFNLPVMVYIHGGGWRTGNPGVATSAKFFMDEDIVLVTVHYRLGPFGFLSTEDSEIPGNMGLKDMALALEWVRKEISAFGGDPRSITAFGLSAGGASVHYLCSALRTRGLLRGCISESGVGGAFWTLPRNGVARSNAYKVANAVGCFGERILSCLQNKSAADILATEKLLKFWTGEPLVIYNPVLEGRWDGALLTQWPTDSNFPWVTGLALNEGKIKSAAIDLFYKNQSYIDDFYENKHEYILRMLNLNEANRDSASKIYSRFFERNNFTVAIEKLISEVYFVAPALKELKRHTGPKFLFVFNATEGISYAELTTLKKPNLTSPGSAHADNLYFFFDASHVHTDFNMTLPMNVEISKKLVKLWVNFAKYQNPSPEGNPEWKQYGDSHNYLYIGNDGLSTRYYQNVEEIIRFWNEIF